MNKEERKTLLLVEDEFLIAMNCTKVLKRFGYEVITAHNGEKAVQIATGEGSIDLILMDIDLGEGLDGPEAASKILAQRLVPIVFLTSHAEREMVERVHGITRYGYVIKNSGDFVLQSSIEMAFELFGANWQIRNEIDMWKRVKENLADSEERYRSLFEAAQDGIIILDAESGRIVDVNPFLVELIGYSKELLVEKMIWEIGFFADLIANKDKFQELQEKKYVRYEDMPLETASGNIIDVEFISNVYLVNDQKVIQCNIREITVRKRRIDLLSASEERYRRLFEAAQDGIIILDAESGRIVDVNPFLINLLGYLKERIVEKTIWEIGLFKDVLANKENFLELQRNEYVRFEDLPIETKEGRIIDVEFISNVYLVDGKKVIQCNVRDITARKRSESLLQKSILENQELLHELQHRAKNSFTMISSMINLAAGKRDTLLGASILEQLDARVRTVSELYSLLYSSGTFLEVRLDEYCASIANATVGANGDIALVLEMDTVSIPTKKAAPIGLILTELIMNAVKYAFPAGRKGGITVSLQKKGGGAILVVTDDGSGLPEGFDPAECSGSGLKLVLGLAEQIEGDFRIEGDVKGTRCSLEFPIQRMDIP